MRIKNHRASGGFVMPLQIPSKVVFLFIKSFGSEEKMKLKSLAVFLASKMGSNQKVINATIRLGNIMAERSIQLVYGGAACGLMGVLADTVLGKGGRVVGVMPRFEHWGEIMHPNLTEMIMVDSMGQRKEVMANRSQASISLPGAWGTLDEKTEYTTMTQLELHSDAIYKPSGILNIDNFYTGYWEFINKRVVGDGYMETVTRDIVIIHEDPATLLDLLEQRISV